MVRNFGVEEDAEAPIRSLPPLCVMCEQEGKTTPAELIDHVIPHKGDAKLFWDPKNCQSLCRFHHDSAKRKDERRGYSTQIGEDGWPVDGNHPIHRQSQYNLQHNPPSKGRTTT
jgi:5-methylcytosine-specific restriction enzyme A